jgi:hypothetical protein
MDLPQLNFRTSNLDPKDKNEITGISQLNDLQALDEDVSLGVNDISEIDGKVVFKFNLDENNF